MPSSRPGTSSKPIDSAVSPAPRKSRAATDHPHAASVPIEMRVSIVAARCRRLVQAFRWNGQPPQSTTGVASARLTHCHPSNCRAGTMASMSTGSERAAETNRRWRSCSCGSTAPGTVVPAAGGSEGAVPGRCDRRNEVRLLDVAGVELDGRSLGRVVHRRCDAVEPVERLLDALRARGAAHALDRQVDALGSLDRCHPSRADDTTQGYVTIDAWRRDRPTPRRATAPIVSRCSTGSGESTVRWAV